MKKLVLPAAIFVCLFAAGCNEADTTLEDHICQAFYDTVAQPGKQKAVTLSDAAVAIDKEHLMYGLSLSSQAGNLWTGNVSIVPSRVGEIVIASSNREADFSLSINGTVVEPVINSNCDVGLYTWPVASANETLSVSLKSSKSQVLLMYSVKD